MALEQRIAVSSFHSQVLRTRGLVPLFEELGRLEVQCREPGSDMVVDPVKYYQASPSEEFYFLSVESHWTVMNVDQTEGDLLLSAGLDYIQDERNEELIQALSRLLDALFPTFAFAFAYIDLEGDPPPKHSEDIEATRIRWLFWANYFGKPYVDKFGKDFLLQAPGWHSEEMPDGSVKYLTRSSPRVEMETDAAREVTAYFARENEVNVYLWEQFGFI